MHLESTDAVLCELLEKEEDMKLQKAGGIWKELEGECQGGYDQNTPYACVEFSDNNDNEAIIKES